VESSTDEIDQELMDYLKQVEHQQMLREKPKKPSRQKRQQTQDKEISQSPGNAAELPPRDRKIPRPPNSFILFGNEWRSKLAAQFPLENNKQISVR
jgi:hypothetical protein